MNYTHHYIDEDDRRAVDELVRYLASVPFIRGMNAGMAVRERLELEGRTDLIKILDEVLACDSILRR